MSILVVGRFPPPFDGGSLATKRLADLLNGEAEVHRLNIEPPVEATSKAKRLAHFLRILPQVRKTLKRYPKATILWPSISPDLAGHFRDMLVTLPAIRQDQRIVAVVHWGNFHSLFESAMMSATARRLVDRADQFVFLSEGLSSQCAGAIPEEKRIVIPNTIDDATVLPQKEVEAKRRERTARDKLNVLFVGHMMPSKGYPETLEAVRLLAGRSVPVEAHFAGGWMKPADRESFLARVASHNLGNIVFHHGAVSDRQAMRTLHRNADVLVLPTWYRNEAQPLAIIEALNAGTPVISTPYRAIPDMFENGEEGYLVPPRDPEAIAEALQKLCDMENWTRMSIQARQRFESTFAPKRVREKWLRVVG